MNFGNPAKFVLKTLNERINSRPYYMPQPRKKTINMLLNSNVHRCFTIEVFLVDDVSVSTGGTAERHF
jgi:hypothetical protein